MLRPTPQQVRELAAAAIVDDRTVRRAYDGRAVKPASRERLTRAARALNIAPPPAAPRPNP